MSSKNASFSFNNNSKKSLNKKAKSFCISKSNNELDFCSERSFLNKKHLLDKNSFPKSFDIRKSNISTKKSKNNSFRSNKQNDENENNENEIIDYEENFDYENEDNNDNIEQEQNEILEAMFIEAKNTDPDDKSEKKINSYLDIINLDETKEKIYSYKCYEEICLIKLELNDNEEFIKFYKKLIEIAHLLQEKIMPIYVKFTAEKFVNLIAKKEKISINHWLEDISKDFNILQKDKVINSFAKQI